MRPPRIGVCRKHRRPRNDVSVRHFVEQVSCVIEMETLCVNRDHVVEEENVIKKAKLYDVRVK